MQFLLAPYQPVLLPCFPPVFLSGAKDFPVPADGRRRQFDGLLQPVFLQFALPDYEHAPSLGLQLPPGVLVSFLVAGYLGGPEVGVGFGDRVVFAVLVAVPEAAVDEDDGAVLGEDDVGGAGEAFVVDAVTEAKMPEGAAQRHLRLSRSGVDLCHYPRSSIFRDSI